MNNCGEGQTLPRFFHCERLIILNLKFLFKLICLIFFAIYVNALFKITLFSSYIVYTPKNGRIPVKLTPEIFHLISTRPTQFMINNLLGNIALFIPFGMLVPVIIYKKSKNIVNHFLLIILLGILLSLAIEFVQHYVVMRIFDIDDIILNTFGAGIGYFIYLVLRYIIMRESKSWRVKS